MAIVVFIYGLSIGVRVGERDCASYLDKETPKTAQSRLGLKYVALNTQPCDRNLSKSAHEAHRIARVAKRGKQKRSCDSSPVQEGIYLHKWKGDIAKNIFHNS